MISLLKNSSIYALLGTLFVIALLRILLITNGIPLLVPELEWMLTGERMHHGFILYNQIWDDLSPLAAAVYWLMDVAFGRSAIAYQIVSLVFVVGQALLFHDIAQRNQLYHEKSNVPALLYGLGMCMSPDFFTLSPVLMGITFLLLALDETFAHIHEYTENDEVFSIGFYTGIATLFYLPFIWFLGFELLCFLLLAATGIRKYFLILVGFLFPVILTVLLFYLIDGLPGLYTNWLTSWFQLPRDTFVSALSLLIIFAPFLLLLLLAGVRLFGGDVRFINYQVRCQQAMFIWLVFAALTIVLTREIAPFVFMCFVPVVAFFGTHVFLLFRRWWINELLFAAWLALVVIIGYHSFPGVPAAWVQMSNLFVQPTTITQEIQNKKLLVMGNGIAHYTNNVPATPYVNWRLAQRHFDDLDNYVTVIDVYENFRRDLPDVIVDPSGKVPELFSRIPALAIYYTKDSSRAVYVRKKGNASIRKTSMEQ